MWVGNNSRNFVGRITFGTGTKGNNARHQHFRPPNSTELTISKQNKESSWRTQQNIFQDKLFMQAVSVLLRKKLNKK